MCTDEAAEWQNYTEIVATQHEETYTPLCVRVCVALQRFVYYTITLMHANLLLLCASRKPCKTLLLLQKPYQQTADGSQQTPLDAHDNTGLKKTHNPAGVFLHFFTDWPQKDRLLLLMHTWASFLVQCWWHWRLVRVGLVVLEADGKCTDLVCSGATKLTSFSETV